MKLPNGLKFAIASVIGTSKTMSALSNATEAVATLEASHGVAVNDIVIVSSGWNALDQRVARAKTVATNDVTLEGIDTSSTTLFPAGSGIGSVREVTTFLAVPNILDPQLTGGDLSFFQYLFVDDPSFTQKQLPTFQSPIALTFSLDDDIAGTAAYLAVKAAAQSRSNTPLRLTLTNGNLIYLNGVWSLREMPNITANEGMTQPVTFSMQSLITRYAA